MRLLFISLVLCCGLVGQVTPARNVQVGPLSCAGRMLGPTTFQHWCYKGGKIVINQVVEILEGTIYAFYADSAIDPKASMILWVVTTPNIYSVTINPNGGTALTMRGVF